MRTLDHDDAQPLGPPIRREPEAKPSQPQPVPGRPGIVRDADGKLSTAIPDNELANLPVLPPIWYAMRR